MRDSNPKGREGEGSCFGEAASSERVAADRKGRQDRSIRKYRQNPLDRTTGCPKRTENHWNFNDFGGFLLHRNRENEKREVILPSITLPVPWFPSY